MAISRKRKQIADETAPSKQTASEAAQRQTKDLEIQTPAKEMQQAKKRKTRQDRVPTPQPQAAPAADRKRKRNLEAVSEEAEEEPAQEPKPQEGFFARFTRPKEIKTPQSQRFWSVLPPSPAQTPSKNAAKLFDRLNIRATSPSLEPANKKQRAYDTPPATPDAEKKISVAVLPEELRDIIRLHSSFLTALSLHYANNGGSTSPVNLKVLLPAITASWKKRSVALNDLRKLLAVGSGADSPFSLEDRGRAGTFLVRLQAPATARRRISAFINEGDLNAQFEKALAQGWDSWCAETAKEHQTGRAFVRQMALADIKKTESVEKTATFFSRGQQRLNDLRNGQREARAEAENERTTVKAEDKNAAAVQNRNASLVDRIFAKQSMLASLPTGSTKAELERKAALQRVEEVSRVLELLAAGKPRVSFSMPAAIQHLQQSMRNGISREEAERCLSLMAGEIMPNFVKVIASGGVRGVVVTRGGKIGSADLKERLANAGA